MSSGTVSCGGLAGRFLRTGEGDFWKKDRMVPLPFFLRCGAGFAGLDGLTGTTTGSISSSVEGGGESEESDDVSESAMVAVGAFAGGRAVKDEARGEVQRGRRMDGRAASSARLALHEVIFPIWPAVVYTPKDSHAFEVMLLRCRLGYRARFTAQGALARQTWAAVSLSRGGLEFWNFGELDALVFSMHSTLDTCQAMMKYGTDCYKVRGASQLCSSCLPLNSETAGANNDVVGGSVVDAARRFRCSRGKA